MAIESSGPTVAIMFDSYPTEQLVMWVISATCLLATTLMYVSQCCKMSAHHENWSSRMKEQGAMLYSNAIFISVYPLLTCLSGFLTVWVVRGARLWELVQAFYEVYVLFVFFDTVVMFIGMNREHKLRAIAEASDVIPTYDAGVPPCGCCLKSCFPPTHLDEATIAWSRKFLWPYAIAYPVTALIIMMLNMQNSPKVSQAYTVSTIISTVFFCIALWQLLCMTRAVGRLYIVAVNDKAVPPADRDNFGAIKKGLAIQFLHLSLSIMRFLVQLTITTVSSEVDAATTVWTVTARAACYEGLYICILALIVQTLWTFFFPEASFVETLSFDKSAKFVVLDNPFEVDVEMVGNASKSPMQRKN